MQKAIIITAPSGAGKTTLVKKILKHRDDLAFSISACTRAKRENEVDGKDYYFLSTEAFKQKVKEEAFAEWEEVYDNMYYGTLMSEIERIWKKNKSVIFDIDVKGAISLKEKLGKKALSIFIAPPSVEVLKERLQGRGTESAESLKRRIDKAIYEISFKDKMDKIIINDDLKLAFEELNTSIEAFLND